MTDTQVEQQSQLTAEQQMIQELLAEHNAQAAEGRVASGPSASREQEQQRREKKTPEEAEKEAKQILGSLGFLREGNFHADAVDTTVLPDVDLRQMYARLSYERQQMRDAGPSVDREVSVAVEKALKTVERQLIQNISVQESETPTAQRVSIATISHEALNQMSQAFVHKDFDTLSRIQQAEVGNRMQLLASYIQSQPEYAALTPEQQGRIDALRRQGERIVYETHEELRAYNQSDTNQEAEAFAMLADPRGKIRHTFTSREGVLNEEGYRKYIRALLGHKDVVFDKFAQGLEEGGKFHRVFTEQHDKAVVETIQTQVRQEVMDSLEVLDTSGHAVKIYERARAEIQELLSQDPSTPTDVLLQRIAEAVGNYNLPDRDSNEPAAYQLASVLTDPEAEIVCAVRELIAYHLIDELLPQKTFVLAETINPSFTAEDGGKVTSKGHVSLIVYNEKTGKAYYFDASTKHGIVQEITDEVLVERIQLAYINRHTAIPNIPTEAGMIGPADEMLMADNLTNMAALADDPLLAKQYAEAALHYYPDSVMAKFVLASLTTGDEQGKYIQALTEADPTLRAMAEQNLEGLRMFLASNRDKFVVATAQDVISQRPGRPGSKFGAGTSYEEWLNYSMYVASQLIDYLNSNSHLTSQEFHFAGYLSAELTQIASTFGTPELFESATAEQKNMIKALVLIIVLADNKNAIGQNDLQTLIRLSETVKSDDIFRLWRNIPGLSEAMALWESVDFQLLGNDHEIRTADLARQKRTIAERLNATHKYSPDQVDTAVKIAELFWINDMRDPMHKSLGEKVSDPSAFGGHSRETFTRIFSLMRDQKIRYMSSPWMKALAKAMTMPEFDAIGEYAGGFTDSIRGREGIQYGLHYMKLLGQWGLSFFYRNSFTNAEARKGMVGTDFGVEDIKHEESRFEEEHRGGPFLRIRRYFEGTGARHRTSRYRGGGASRADLEARAGQLAGSVGTRDREKMEEELRFIESRSSVWDRRPAYRKYRDMFRQEALARQLVYEAHIKMTSEYTATDELYEIFISIGERVTPPRGRTETLDAYRERCMEAGKKVNEVLFGVMGIETSRNMSQSSLDAQCAFVVMYEIEQEAKRNGVPVGSLLLNTALLTSLARKAEERAYPGIYERLKVTGVTSGDMIDKVFMDGYNIIKNRYEKPSTPFQVAFRRMVNDFESDVAIAANRTRYNNFLNGLKTRYDADIERAYTRGDTRTAQRLEREYAQRVQNAAIRQKNAERDARLHLANTFVHDIAALDPRTAEVFNSYIAVVGLPPGATPPEIASTAAQARSNIPRYLRGLVAGGGTISPAVLDQELGSRITERLQFHQILT